MRFPDEIWFMVFRHIKRNNLERQLAFIWKRSAQTVNNDGVRTENGRHVWFVWHEDEWRLWYFKGA